MKNIFWLLCLSFVTSCATKSDVENSETEINDNKDSISEEEQMAAIKAEILESLSTTIEDARCWPLQVQDPYLEFQKSSDAKLMFDGRNLKMNKQYTYYRTKEYYMASNPDWVTELGSLKNIVFSGNNYQIKAEWNGDDGYSTGELIIEPKFTGEHANRFYYELSGGSWEVYGYGSKMSQKEFDKIIKSFIDNAIVVNPLTVLEEQILGNPESPNGYYKRALYYKNHYKFKMAVDDINRALKLAPESAAMNYAKADIQYAAAMYKGDISLLDQAEIYLNYALEYDSINADALLLLAELTAAYSEPDKAMVYVNRVLKENQYLPRPYYVKGKIYESLGNMKLAESSYQTAIEMDANYYAAMIQLGWIYAQQQNDLALTYYDAALEIYPESMEAIRNKGLYLHFSNKPLKARAYFYKMLEIDSTFEEAYFNIGNTYVGIYRDDMVQYTKDTIVEKALENFQKAVDINPGYIQAWYNLGLGNEVKGDKQTAREVYNYILTIETNYEPAIEGLNRL